MHWLLLALAILAEVAGTTALKLSAGFSKLLPSILMFVFYIISFSVLSFALKGIPVSVAYAIWSAVGTALVVTIGVLFFSEQLSVVKIVSIILIIIGVVGLNLGERQHENPNNTANELMRK